MNCPHCACDLGHRPDLIGQTFSCPNCFGPFTYFAPIPPPVYYPPQATFEAPIVDPMRTTIPRSNAYGIASIALAVLSLAPGFHLFFPPIAVTSFILGWIGSGRQSRETYGRKLAVCGMVLSSVSLAIAAAFVALMIFGDSR